MSQASDSDTPPQSPQTALREAIDVLEQAASVYTDTMCNWQTSGGTMTERRFSEGERDDTADENLHEGLADLTFRHINAILAALAERPAIEREALSVESISRAIDPGAWEHELPGMTRAAVEGFHLRRQQANAAAERVAALLPARSEPVVDGAAEVEDATWRKYQADFNAMTDAEIEEERARAQDLLDEQEDWLDALASWKAAGKPRTLQPAEAK
jgi:hypothetical protein